MASISSKKREAGKLRKRCLTLDEKIKILDKVKKSKMSSREIAEHFKIGKTQAANVVKNEITLRAEHENFRGKGFKHLKRENHQKYKDINTILYKWFKKCEASGIYISGPLLKEEAISIKDLLKNPDLNDFKASEGWLEKWKLSYGIREKQISGESLDVSEVTVGSRIERLRELCKGYHLKDTWNMNESGCFFKALPSKGLAHKGKKCKGGKKSKQRMTVAFFVSADGGKVGKPIVIWKSKKPRCFKRSNAALKLEQVSYFADPKSWMQINIMENVLDKLNNKMKAEKRNVLLFLDNAPVHPEGLQGKYSNIKVTATATFLPKNTTSRLQPLDAGIIKNFKVKYRKKLLRHVISRITNDLMASDIAKEVDILQAITWLAAAWNEVTEKTIRNCFAKCGILEQTAENDDAELDGEFAELFKELTEMDEVENDLTADGYIDFEINVPSCHPPINSEMVDWKATSIQESFDEYVNKEYVELDSEDDQEPIVLKMNKNPFK